MLILQQELLWIENVAGQELSTATYILNLYADVKQLTDCLASYTNYLLYLKTKLGIQNGTEVSKLEMDSYIQEKKIDSGELEALNEIARLSRYWALQSYIKFMGLAKKIKEVENSKTQLESLYREIQRDPVPKYETLEQFVILNHELFATSSLSELLVKSQEYYNKVSGINESTLSQ